MDVMEKLEILGRGAQYDLCGACMRGSDPAAHRQRGYMGRWIYPSVLPNGSSILLLKVLMYNVCENNCLYCIHRSGNDRPIVSFKPEELATLFIKMLKAGMVEGLFLSSTIFKSTRRTMDDMLTTIEILRHRYHFKGYIHLKILPGANLSQIEQAVRLASRVSINIETPSASWLSKIAPDKDFYNEIISTIQTISRSINRGNQNRGRSSCSQTTQFIVGVDKEPDREILEVTSKLYKGFGLSRVYFSAFQPFEGTPLEGRHPTHPLREHRLYQVDFLLRQYGFSLKDIGFTVTGNLSLHKDPKTVWAEAHPGFFPVEINTAPKEILLRVPGIGPRTIKKILHIRRDHTFSTIDELKRLGAITKNAAPYILLNGKKPPSRYPLQPSLWEDGPIHFALSPHLQS